MIFERKLTRRKLVGAAALASIVSAARPHAQGLGIGYAEVGVMWSASRARATAAQIPATIDLLIVTRFDDQSPPCPARYVRSTAGPEHPGRFRTADGSTWQIAESVIDVFMLGSDGDAVQRAIECLFGRPGIVRVPDQEFATGSSIHLRSGQTLSGLGWSTVPNSDEVSNGSRIRFTSSKATIEIAGASEDSPIERVRLASIAITGGGGGTGIVVRNARQLEFSDIYVNRFAIGIRWGPTVWLCRYERVQCFACQLGFELDSGAEDSVFESCMVRYADVALRINYHAQTLLFIGCDFGYARVAVQMLGGMLVSATFNSCYFEMDGSRGENSSVFEITAPASTNRNTYPSVTCTGCRFHAIGAAEGTLPVFRVIRANIIALTDARPGGSFAEILRCDDATQLGSLRLRDNAQIGRSISKGDARLAQKITTM